MATKPAFANGAQVEHGKFGFGTVPIEEWLGETEMAFVGFGLDHRGAARLNLYLKALPESRRGEG